MPTNPMMERLKEAAILVHLRTRNWTGVVVDKTASRLIQEATDALPGAGRFMKNLVPRSARQALQRALHAARQTHRDLTLPWNDDAQRLLPMSRFDQYKKEMAKKEETMLRVRREFVACFDEWIALAEATNGKLFNRGEYPETAEELHERIGMDITYQPVPAGDHLVVGLAEEEIAKLRAGIEEDTRTRLAHGVADMHRRLAEALRAVCERVDEDENGKPKIFRNSLIGNLVTALEFGADANLTDDARLKQVIETMRAAVDGVTADQVRNDPEARKQVRDAAASALGDFYGGIQ